MLHSISQGVCFGLAARHLFWLQLPPAAQCCTQGTKQNLHGQVMRYGHAAGAFGQSRCLVQGKLPGKES